MSRLVLAACVAVSVQGTGNAPVKRDIGDRNVSTFVEEARAATARYRDREAAIADGYRLIGDDFPGMGEHWIHIGLLFDGGYEATRPEVLTYVTVSGTPRLLGIAYALPLLDGEVPPDEPAGRAAWHAHAGSVDEESLSPHHHHSGHADHGPRLAMVHAWVWLENPEGMFAADNWAIPFLRLGLEAPPRPAPQAGKALSLLSGAHEPVAGLVRAAAAPAYMDENALRAAIATASARAENVVARRTGPRLSPEAVAELAMVWGEMWLGIEALLPPEAVERLASQSMR